jgi:hypothetical protein
MGFGVRGLWSMEGKMLFLLDGVRMNEALYGNPIFARYFSTTNIDHIEIIRGPGSAIYGEYGELAVVNIISRKSTEVGGNVAAMYGLTNNAVMRRMGSVGYRARLGDTGVAVDGFVGDGRLNDRDYANRWDERYSLADFTKNNAWMANAAVDRGGFTLRFIGGSYTEDRRIGSGYNDDGTPAAEVAYPLETSFESYNVDAQYKWRPFENWTLTPRATYISADSWKRDREWVFGLYDDPYYARRFYGSFPKQEFVSSLTSAWDITPNMSYVVGVESRVEKLKVNYPSYTYYDPYIFWFYSFGYYPNVDESSLSRVNGYHWSAFSEYSWRTPVVDMTAGVRYDRNNVFGVARLPRFALSKKVGAFYTKLLTTRAYHPPSLKMHYWSNVNLKPEYSRDYEAEVGYSPSHELTARVNVFQIKMDPAIFYSGEFSNAQTGSRGLESELALDKRWGSLKLGYSYYRAFDNNLSDTMAIDESGAGVPGVTQGMPTNKITASAVVPVGERLSVAPGVIWYSKRYNTYSAHFWNTDAMSVPPEPFDDYIAVNQEIAPTFLANLYVRYKAPGSGWDFGVGVFNLTDADYTTANAYYYGDPAKQGPSREWVFKASYSW